jgi:hypothetical protein
MFFGFFFIVVLGGDTLWNLQKFKTKVPNQWLETPAHHPYWSTAHNSQTVESA